MQRRACGRRSLSSRSTLLWTAVALAVARMAKAHSQSTLVVVRGALAVARMANARSRTKAERRRSFTSGSGGKGTLANES